MLYKITLKDQRISRFVFMWTFKLISIASIYANIENILHKYPKMFLMFYIMQIF